MTQIFLFPGQGSQKQGMGAELFDSFPELIEQADFTLGYSIKTLCLQNPDENLEKTQFTQVALYVVSALSHLKFLSETGIKPDYSAGHSVGEYNALLSAGVFDWISGLKMVARRGEIMSRAPAGSMAAILGTNPEKIRSILDEAGLETVDIANFNAPTQTVISGLKADIEQAKIAFQEKDIRHFIVLKTGGAFHSRYMQAAKNEFEIFLNDFQFQEPQFPVLSNVNALPYEAKNLKTKLAEQITAPVRWSEIMHYFLKLPKAEFHELGSGSVLTGLLKQIKRTLHH